MRQVPSYLIIGNGRVAKHLIFYLNACQLPCHQWSRATHNDQQLKEISSNCSHVLLLIKDASISTFISQHPFLKEKMLIHCSGALTLDTIYSAHPLITFTHDLYPLSTYKKIPFIIEKEGPLFSELLPGLPNQAYRIPQHLKPKYHALCVLSGNFSVMLWQKLFNEMQNTFDLPHDVTHLYLEQTLKNLLKDPFSALTGPLARNDKNTITANIKALDQDPYQAIYESFVKLFNHEEKCDEYT